MMTTVSIDTVGAASAVPDETTVRGAGEIGVQAASGEAVALFQRSLAEQTVENGALEADLRAAMALVSETLAKVSSAADEASEATADVSEVTADAPEATADAPEATADALVAAGVTAPQAAPVEGAAPQAVTLVAPVDVVRMQAVEATPSAVLVQAAEAVADALLVTPGLLEGQGEILVQLRPDVLEGTEVKISVTGRQLDVVFQPQTVDMAVLIENCRTTLVQHLAAKIVSFNVSVDVRKKRG